MPTLIFLGTSNAIPDEQHENTHLLLSGNTHNVLIDCAGSTYVRLNKIGLDFTHLGDLILTHFHPDHISGVPQLLMNMWLLKRSLPFSIYGLSYTLDRVEELMGLFDWSGWEGLYPIQFHRIPESELAPVLDFEEFKIFSSPVQHLVPTMGLRIEFKESKKVLAYSSDTQPCSQMLRLSAGADVLVHEASGLFPGHSSAAQAGEAAAQAGAASLYLIHYPTGRFSADGLVAEARKRFEGPVVLAEDFNSIGFD
jgi:ribonuclease Z